MNTVTVSNMLTQARNESAMGGLACVGVRRRFGARVVLSDIMVQVSAGSTLGLLGPNGSGKSTLLHILSGALPASDGHVFFRGEALDDHSDPHLRARMSTVFQTPAVDPRLSGWQNLMLAADLYAISRATASDRAETLLRLFGLLDRRDDTAGTLSGGNLRRLDLCRALMGDPDLLLLDEPTAGLDEASFRAFWSMLHADQKRRARTLIVATHRPEEAERLQHLLVLNEGKVVARGTPEELLRHVGDDIIELDIDAGSDAVRAAIRQDIKQVCGQDAEPVPDFPDRMRVRVAQAHRLVAKLVDAVGPRHIRAVHLKKPSLADAFLKLTGRPL